MQYVTSCAQMAKAKQLTKAAFIESMECMPVTTLPEGPGWTYEIKLDGYRLEAIKSGGAGTFRHETRLHGV